MLTLQSKKGFRELAKTESKTSEIQQLQEETACV